MVYKVSKGGVRSGNTLRGLRTLRTRRYFSQGCIIGHSNLSPRDLSRLVKSSSDDDAIRSTLRSTDVILSLNKKQRWRLPAQVNQMIKMGCFNEENATVALLERHKLKKKANCVSFVCNKGRHVAPKQKRYFSFNVETIGTDESKRFRKLQIAKEKKKLGNHVDEVKDCKYKTNVIQTVNAFTLSKSHKAGVEPKSRPELYLQVYYPCPKSCSLPFNPKYTDVIMEEGDDGKPEIRSNQKWIKKQNKRRHRLTNKDLARLNPDMLDEDYEENWDDEDEKDTDGQAFDVIVCQDMVEQFGTVMSLYSDKDVHYDEGKDKQRSFLSENILSSLVAQAEKAKTLSSSVTLRRKKTAKSRRAFEAEFEEKSHVVYGEVLKLKNNSDQVVESDASQQDAIKSTVSLVSARIIISTSETSPDVLRNRFACLYTEADCQPRRFIINITDDVHTLVATPRVARQDTRYMSYLVFVHDGHYEEGWDTFKVIFNSNICLKTDSICQSIPFERTSVDGVMKRIVSALLDLKASNLLLCEGISYNYQTTASMFDFINKQQKINVLSVRTSDEIVRTADAEIRQEQADFPSSLDKMAEDFDLVMFCELCYENVNPTEIDAQPGTSLNKCAHIFCDACWRSYIITKIKNGAVKMACPGYQCHVAVGPVVLLSLLHVSELMPLWARMAELAVTTSSNSKWCPNPECGRIIQLNTKKSTASFSFDVHCPCGTNVCFACLSQPHWPAKCHQAEAYMEKIPTLKLPEDAANVKECVSFNPTIPQAKTADVVEVKGRICPKCRRFFEKMEGRCPWVLCLCGHIFCWNCLEANMFHSGVYCKPKTSIVYNYARVVKVRHIENSNSQRTQGQEEVFTSKPTGARRKVTLYQKAVKERLEAKTSREKQIRDLAKEVVRLASKDLALKREMLSLCGMEAQDFNEAALASSDLALYARKFLNSCEEMKKALHHVAEFTYVLLQDASNSLEKRKALRVADDLSGFCSFVQSILELGQNQDAQTAVRRLVDIKAWSQRVLGVLLSTLHQLRH